MQNYTDSGCCTIPLRGYFHTRKMVVEKFGNFKNKRNKLIIRTMTHSQTYSKVIHGSREKNKEGVQKGWSPSFFFTEKV
jgi:uncharacterized coiled-coil DUF342 family protein